MSETQQNTRSLTNQINIYVPPLFGSVPWIWNMELHTGILGFRRRIFFVVFFALALFFLLWVTQVKRVLIRFTLAALVSVSRRSGRLFQIQRCKVPAPSLRSAK